MARIKKEVKFPSFYQSWKRGNVVFARVFIDPAALVSNLREVL
jgi:hypothetical protein